MRVAVVTETFPKLSETFVVNHIRGLMDAGVEVDIFAFYGRGEERINGFVTSYGMLGRTSYKPFEPLPQIPRMLGALRILAGNLGYLRPLLRSLDFFNQGKEALRLHRFYESSTFLTRRRYDIVHCHFGITAEKLALFQDWGLMQAPLVTSFHGYELDDRTVVREGMYRALQRRGSLFIANSGYTRGRLEDFGFDMRKTVISPVSLDTVFFSRQRSRSVKPFRLLTVGRLVPFKGVAFALRALALARTAIGDDVKYSIVGTGPEEASIRELITRLGLEEQVEMLGDRTTEEVRELMEEAHVLLLTGIRAPDGRVENQGLVLQEAQSMEVPVIAADVGGVSEGLIDGVTGFLVPEKDIEAIADRICKIHDNPDMMLRMGREGRVFVEGRYDIALSTRALISHYEELI